MAYGQKYQITYATKPEKNVVIKIYELGYTSSTIIQFQGTGINLQYLPKSDDPYEPIYASQLGISIDITDNASQVLDFTNINDRFLYVEMYVNSVVEWVGWVLNDYVSISYSTGIKELNFNAVDGLGMLQDIPFPIQDFTWLGCNETQNLLFLMWGCLKAIQFPVNRNIITMCSYYSAGMFTRADYIYADPFRQAYLPYRTFMDDSGNFMNALDILSNIAKSFGCRVFQAKGKWWIVSINEFASINSYYTEYNSVASRVDNHDGNQMNTSSQIQGFTSNTSGLYFIDNSQFKLLKKGFNKVQSEGNVEMATNYMANWTLKQTTSGNADYWTTAVGVNSSIALVNDPESVYDTFEMSYTGTNPASFVSIQNNYMPQAAHGDCLNLAMTLQCGITTGVVGLVDITLTNGSATWYLASDGTWQTGTTSYIIYNPTTGSVAQPFVVNIKTNAFPIDGQLSFKYRLQYGPISFLSIGNFQLQLKSTVARYRYKNYINDSKQYVKSINLPYGFFGGDIGVPLYPSQKGVLLLATGYQADMWRRYGIDTVNYFGTLQELVVKQYINVFGKNIINVDCSLSSFYTTNANYPLLDASKLIFATDTDPAAINISADSYMLGNCTIDYAKDETQATLLQISNTNIESTKETKYFYQSSSF